MHFLQNVFHAKHFTFLTLSTAFEKIRFKNKLKNCWLQKDGQVTFFNCSRFKLEDSVLVKLKIPSTRIFNCIINQCGNKFKKLILYNLLISIILISQPMPFNLVCYLTYLYYEIQILSNLSMFLFLSFATFPLRRLLRPSTRGLHLLYRLIYSLLKTSWCTLIWYGLLQISSSYKGI